MDFNPGSLYLHENEAPQNFYKFSSFTSVIGDCQIDVNLPMFVHIYPTEYRPQIYNDVIIIQQTENGSYERIARFFNRYNFSHALEEILKSSTKEQDYRLHLKQKNFPEINKFEITFTVYITKELLRKLFEGKKKVPKVIKYLIKENSIHRNRSEVNQISPTDIRKNKKISANFKSELYQHQNNNIHWMNNLEISIDNDLAYETFKCPIGADKMFVKSLNMTLLLDRDDKLIPIDLLEKVLIKPKGGVLADEIGLGKTLSCIGLISEGLSRSDKTTLILCPRRLCKQWKTEIEKFTNLKSVIVSSIVHHRKLTKEKINEIDIVIVSYSFLLNRKYTEWLKYKATENDFILSNYLWRRVILDEGHELTRNNTKSSNFNHTYAKEFNMFTEICKMKSDYRWIVSGTPFPDYRRGNIIRHYLYYESIKRNKQYTIDHIHYRMNYDLVRKNTKESLSDIISIPEPIIQTEFLDMTEIEKIIYKSALGNIDKQIQLCNHIKVSDHHLQILGNKPMSLLEIHQKMSKYYENRIKYYKARINNLFKSLEKIIHTFILVKRIQTIVRKKFSFEKAYYPLRCDNSVLEIHEKIQKLRLELSNHCARLKIFNSLGEKLNQTKCCPICLDEFDSKTQIVTKCGHFSCADCMQSMFLNKNKINCHICRCELENNDIRVLENNNIKEMENNNVNKWGTKMARLIDYLNVTLENTDNKVIVFSQWNNMLKLVKKILVESNISHVLLNGSMYVVNSRICKFKLDDSVRVVLLSSDKASSGLNLTEASHIVLLDTLNTDKNSSRVIEEQAIGRAVRIGQKKRVAVQRFIMRDTIEHDFYIRNL